MQDDLSENLFYAKENISFLIDKKFFFNSYTVNPHSEFHGELNINPVGVHP